MNEKTKEYYDQIGWKRSADENFRAFPEDLRRWEDLRSSSYEYNRLGEHRIYRHIPESGEKLLDVGCGPLVHTDLLNKTSQYKEYHCVDFSSDALGMASSKLGSRGRCYQGDFLSIPLPESTFDCVLSLSCLFHIQAELQEAFVRKLLRVAKPEAPIIVSYANPQDFTSLVQGLQDLLDSNLPLYPSYAYYHIHPMDWWWKFLYEATIDMYPSRTLRSVDQRRLIPDGPLGTALLSALAILEDTFQERFLKYGHYYTVILKKRTTP